MSCPTMAQLLSNTLYYKRFFPYYSFNVLGGLDNEGKGCVFTYIVVGSYEKVGYSSQGSGSTLIMPVLDKRLKAPRPLLLPAQDAVTPLSEAEAIDLVKTSFVAATEREIYTGDREDTKQWKPMRRAYGAVLDMANPPTSSGPITLRFQATTSLGYTYWVQSTNAIPKVWKSGPAYEATAKLITK
ncbi:proteasome subunit beta type-1-like [Humulus lupulus]|uniref:proteasome subunit beta type-1-like n=1 Tax=Humulus lupulus TaxID=3486 RepID=UPI002B404410|nr:proteasome subunit beta type-1-like [Humulus lupulus]